MSMIRGACPSIDRPMETGDGLLTRLTPVSGCFTPAELSKIAMAASECGNGVLEVSTRGNLQVRGLSASTLPTFMTRIDEARLKLNRNVPVVVNPLAGFVSDEIKDPRDMQARLRAALQETDLFERLSPKTSIIVDSGSAFNLSRLIGDIRLKAVCDEKRTGWHIYTGRTEARSKLFGKADNDELAVATVMELLTRIATHGKSARGRDLEIVDFTDLTSSFETPIAPSSPHVKSQIPVGVFALKSGAFAVGLALAYGTTNSESILLLARDAESAGAKKIEPAQAKTILVSEMDETAAQEFQESVAAHGYICDPHDPRLKIITCAGTPACKSGFIKTHDLANEIVAEYAADLKGDICVHISACEKRCAQPGRPAIEILGGEAGATISGEEVGEVRVAGEEVLPAIGQMIKKRNI